MIIVRLIIECDLIGIWTQSSVRLHSMLVKDDAFVFCSEYRTKNAKTLLYGHNKTLRSSRRYMQQSPSLEACPPPPEYSWMTRHVSVFTFYLQLIFVEFYAFYVGVSTVWGGDCTGWYIHSSHWQADPLAAQPLEDIKMERRQRHTHTDKFWLMTAHITHTHTQRRTLAHLNLSSEIRRL